MALNERQEKFCIEYLVDFHVTNAAIRAGYSEKTAYSIGSENLKKPEIQERLKELQKEDAESKKISREKVIAEYAKLAFFDIRKVLTVDGGLKETTEWDDDSAAAIAGLESFDEKDRASGEVLGIVRKIKVSDKRAALDSLCKVLGYNSPEEIKHTGEVKIIEIPNNGRNDKAATGLPTKGVK
jgi:phage terminase small subunit